MIELSKVPMTPGAEATKIGGRYYLKANWPAPANIQAWSTTRLGGKSDGAYQSFNLASHVGDDIEKVQANRQLLAKDLNLPCDPLWLNQQHSDQLLALDHLVKQSPKGSASWMSATETAVFDGSYTRQKGAVLCVMTADCLPVLFCSQRGDFVAAVHAGWRGLAQGILIKTVQSWRASFEQRHNRAAASDLASVKQLNRGEPNPDNQLMAWIGPAIGPQAFEVGSEVRAAFLAQDKENQAFFSRKPDEKQQYFADLTAIARRQLVNCGVACWSSGYCSYQQPEWFFSYRRDGQCGRMASLIWIDATKD